MRVQSGRPFRQLVHSDSVGSGPIVVKIVVTGSPEHTMQLKLQRGGLYDRLRVVPSLTLLDGPLCNFDVNTSGEPLTAFVMRRLTPLREWVSMCGRLLYPTQQVASVTTQLLEVRVGFLPVYRCPGCQCIAIIVIS
jgi:hypothetical protein